VAAGGVGLPGTAVPAVVAPGVATDGPEQATSATETNARKCRYTMRTSI
jgi:hypothetical protein